MALVLTLHSSASNLEYPRNTHSGFTVVLPQPIDLARNIEYEIGLGEMHFSGLIANVKDCWIKIHRGSGLGIVRGDKISMVEGFYATVPEFLQAMSNQLGFIAPELSVHVQDFTHRVVINIYQPLTLEMSRNLASILGYSSPVLESTITSDEPVSYVGQEPIDIFKNLGQFYVYSDLCVPTVVSNTMLPILRIVDTGIGGHTGKKCVRFTKINFVPLAGNNFDRVRIYIKLADNSYAPLMSGPSIVTLHIRRRSSRSAVVLRR